MFRYIWSGGALLVDLSKACHRLPLIAPLTSLLIAKLQYCKTTLSLITDYLTNRLQHLKIATTFSSYLEVFSGNSRRSMLRPILFNPCSVNDLMFFINETEF